MKPLDEIRHENILSYCELDTPYGLTSRFNGVTGEAANTIYSLGLCTQDRLLRGIGGIGVLIDSALEKKDLLPSETEAIRDTAAMLPALTELIRGIGTTLYSVAYESEKYDIEDAEGK